MTLELQARYVQISDRQYHRWRVQGAEEEEGPYRDLLDAIEQGLADNAAEALAGVIKAGREGNWTAHAWMLERRHGYVREGRVETMPADGTDALSPEAIDALLTVLAERAPQKLQRALEGRQNPAPNEPEPTGA